MHRADCRNITPAQFLRSMGLEGFGFPAQDLELIGDAIRFRFAITATGSVQAISGNGGVANTDPNINAYLTPAQDTKWWLAIQAYKFSLAHRDANNADMVSTLLNGTFLDLRPQGKLGYVYQAMPGAEVDIGGFGLELQTTPDDLTRTWARAEQPGWKFLPRPALMDMEHDVVNVSTPNVTDLADTFLVLDIKGWAASKKVFGTEASIAPPDGLERWVRRKNGADKNELIEKLNMRLPNGR